MDNNLDNATREIAMVRATGECNMFDSVCVQRVAHEMDLYDLVNIIGEIRDRLRDKAPYMEALTASGEVREFTDEEQGIIDEYRDARDEEGGW